jgi:hypothetical protein
MKIHEIKLYQEFDAPVEKIWEAFNDHANFGKMMGQNIKRVVDSNDAGNVNGLGSVRQIKLPLLPFEETIVKSEKPNCIEYKITKGTPLNYHYGSMQFKSIPGGKSAIDYSIKLGSKIPLLGGVIANALGKGIGSGLKNYARRLNK